MLLRSCVLVVLLALGGCNAPSSESAETRDEPETPVAVVKTEALAPAEIARNVEGVAAIINPDALLQLDADLRSAVIASEFSKSQLNRAETLMQTSVAVSKQTYENAQRQSESDITRLNLLEFRLRQVWGDDAPFLATESRRQLVGELSAGTRALVRIDFPDSYGSAPRNIRVAPLSRGAETPVETVWVAPAGNQSMPGVSYFGLIPAGPGLRHGDRARVVADAASERAGLVIPNSAIVVYASEAWCYVETEPQKFERRSVPLDYPVDEGYLVTAGFEAGDKIVVRGASTLLSREVAPDFEGEDDDDDAAKNPKHEKPESSAASSPIATHASSPPEAQAD
jgi:hypothetical protein